MMRSHYVAMIVGIRKYDYVGSLGNPIRDARLVRELLRGHEFEVDDHYHEDIKTGRDFGRAVDKFASAAKHAKVAVVYFAGHGFCLGSENYLAATQFEDNPSEFVDLEAYPLKKLLGAACRASKFGALFLDCCRYQLPGTNSLSNNDETPKGGNYVVFYAAEPQEGASDGEGQSENGPFALALKKHLSQEKTVGDLHDSLQAELSIQRWSRGRGVDKSPLNKDLAGELKGEREAAKRIKSINEDLSVEEKLAKLYTAQVSKTKFSGNRAKKLFQEEIARIERQRDDLPDTRSYEEFKKQIEDRLDDIDLDDSLPPDLFEPVATAPNVQIDSLPVVLPPLETKRLAPPKSKIVISGPEILSYLPTFKEAQAGIETRSKIGFIGKILGRDGSEKQSQIFLASLPMQLERLKALRPQALVKEFLALREFRQHEEINLDTICLLALAHGIEAFRRSDLATPTQSQVLAARALYYGNVVQLAAGMGKPTAAFLGAIALMARDGQVVIYDCEPELVHRDATKFRPVCEILGISTRAVVEMNGAHEETLEEGQPFYEIEFADLNMATSVYLEHDGRGCCTAEDLLPKAAIFQQADRTLVDEAVFSRALSVPGEELSAEYCAIRDYVADLAPRDFISRDNGSLWLNDEKVAGLEHELRNNDLLSKSNGLNTPGGLRLHRILEATLRAGSYKRGYDYEVVDGKVVLRDTHTGELGPLSKFSEGLHQALEARENLPISGETRIIAKIDRHAFACLHQNLSGLTSHATDVEEVVTEIYGLDIEVINCADDSKKSIKIEEDLVFLTDVGRNNMVFEVARQSLETGQPVLIAVPTPERGIAIGQYLDGEGFTYELALLDNPQSRAVLGEAGVPSKLTIATKSLLAGQIIPLGGAEETMREAVCELGGIRLLVVEREWQRRHDEQLLGILSNGGAPAIATHLLTFDDRVMRIFNGGRMDTMLRGLGAEEHETISHPWIDSALRKAQLKICSRSKAQLLDVIKLRQTWEEIRKNVSSLRHRIVSASEEGIFDLLAEFRTSAVHTICEKHLLSDNTCNKKDAANEFEAVFGSDLRLLEHEAQPSQIEKQLIPLLIDRSHTLAQLIRDELGDQVASEVAQDIIFAMICEFWPQVIEEEAAVYRSLSGTSETDVAHYKSSLEGLYNEMKTNVVIFTVLNWMNARNIVQSAPN